MTRTPTGKFAIPIGGVSVTIPGVYTVADKSSFVAPRGVPRRTMAIVASASGGYTDNITRVLNGDEARLLRAGIGAQMARAAFQHGISELYFVRVDQAVPSELNLGVAKLSALNPGKISNAFQAKTAQNSERADAMDLFLKDASGAESPETYRMVGPLVDITYTGGANGTGTAPSITVTASQSVQGNSVTITFAANNDPAAGLVVDSLAVPDLSSFVEAVNRSTSWTAKLVGRPSIPLEVVNEGAVSFNNNATTLIGGKHLLALLLRESRIARLLDTTPVAAGTGPGGLRINDTYEFLQGGSDGPAPVAADYISALGKLESIGVTGIALGTDDPAVVSALSAHLERQSGVKNRMERFGAAGISPQLTKEAFITKTLELANLFSDVDRLMIPACIPYDTNLVSRRLERQHGALAAAAIVAMKVGNRPEMPLTNKVLKFARLEHTFNTEELEVLIENGVMPIHFDSHQGRHVIVSGNTTWTADSNTASRKIHAIDSIDYINKKIRERVHKLAIGKVADEALIKAIVADIAGLLGEEVRNTRNPNGVLTDGRDPQTGEFLPAYRNLEAVFDGYDLVDVKFDANLVGEVSYIRIRSRFTPARIEYRQPLPT